MAFRVGMEVECVDDGRAGNRGHLTPLVVGRRYVVSMAFTCAGISGVCLEDVDSPAGTRGFWSELFRPVQKRKTSIECFTALLNTKSVEELV